LVKGYQSIRQARLTINDGEIVRVSGENNRGKSAIIRALKAFVLNQSGDSFINSHMPKTDVAVKDKAAIYRWSKKPKTASYFKDKTEKPKLNKAPLAEIFPESGFDFEKEGSDYFVPFFAEEGEILFPFNLNKGTAFKIFSKFLSSPVVSKVINDMKVTVKENSDDLKTLENKIESTESALSASKDRLKLLPNKEGLSVIESHINEYLLRKQKFETKVELFNSALDKYEKIKLEAPKMSLKDLKILIQKIEILIEEYENYKNLNIKNNKIQYLKERIEFCKDAIEKNKRLAVYKDKIGNAIHKLDIVDRLRSAMAKRNLYESLLKKADISYRNNKRELDKFKFCPFCGGKIDEQKGRVSEAAQCCKGS
jgi:hypothetical protein